jgi:3-isopropylmalate dehydrogenase
MTCYNVAVLPGDGIGPEVMAEALNVLEAVGRKYGFTCEFKEGYVGGAAYDRFETPLPQETLELCHSCDAVLLGSVGGPKWDHLPPQLKPELGGLLALRKHLKLYANLRPVKLFDALKQSSPLSQTLLTDGIDLLTVRELAGGIYFAQPKQLDENQGMDTMSYSREEVTRIAHVAFKMARKRRKQVASVDKANVLYSSMLWRETVTRVGENYPDVQLQHLYVDNAAMQMILNPNGFDVILTTNLFGDILTDESAAICGSLGVLPSASLGETRHLFEPAGGSAPDIAGKGIANPIAQILSAALMLDYSFGLVEASANIYQAVDLVLNQGYRTPDIALSNSGTVSTSQLGNLICEAI